MLPPPGITAMALADPRTQMAVHPMGHDSSSSLNNHSSSKLSKLSNNQALSLEPDPGTGLDRATASTLLRLSSGFVTMVTPAMCSGASPRLDKVLRVVFTLVMREAPTASLLSSR